MINKDQNSISKVGTFEYDLELLKKHQKDVIVLGSDSGGKILVSTAFQGRIMTSTMDGLKGRSLGWINHDLIASGKIAPHMHAVGGEERIWLGPEGGQFSIYFKKGVDFQFENWFVPPAFDTESFELVEQKQDHALFRKQCELVNYSGTPFKVSIDRNIRMISMNELQQILGLQLPDQCKFVGFESTNTLTNHGDNEWNEKSGMLSIWILSMLKVSDSATVCIPYKPGPESTLGKIVTDDYFGKIPKGRIRITDHSILLKADGHYRSKIGISPKRAMPFAGSYDSENNILTIANFSLPEHEKRYVNSLWKIQDDPFSGDAVNAYNDGPVNGKQMGAFYEIESSSPAANLEPGKSIKHIHRTFHFSGPKEELDQISTLILGMKLDEIKTQL
ncbi:MAG: DUF6786 family protein [Chitinophagaceae bacterium]